jgi:hypothetical protein
MRPKLHKILKILKILKLASLMDGVFNTPAI